MGLKSSRPIVFIVFDGLLAIWFVLTLLAQREGERKVQEICFENSGQNALIVAGIEMARSLGKQAAMFK